MNTIKKAVQNVFIVVNNAFKQINQINDMDPITVGLIVTLGGGAVLAILRRRWEIQDIKKKAKIEEVTKFNERIQKLESMVSSMQKGIWRLNKVSIIQAKILDDQTEKNHPELASSLEDITAELLKESDKG